MGGSFLQDYCKIFGLLVFFLLPIAIPYVVCRLLWEAVTLFYINNVLFSYDTGFSTSAEIHMPRGPPGITAEGM